ncbi:hypothetical protein CAEBREN_06058 [Caenorhabditis brenneri]|uniref:Uncharacterized protein n=1 Tax=Caenorhabditis brenneri TaxID=135651 RepID=G0PA33_CAEBE|nr:hypothetical protein CAEBREN_06058 [Caenorhabditis brenneri]
MAGYDCPLSAFPSVIGRPSHNTVLHVNGADNQDFYVGHEAQTRREILSISHPIKNRTVTNWDDLNILMDHTFKNELHLSPEMYPVLLADTFSTQKAHRQKMTEIMFERFNVPAYYVAQEAVLALYASGRLTGLVINSGERGTEIISINEGFAVPHTYLSLELGGQKLTDFLDTLLVEKRYSFNTSIVQDMKEKLCCVAPNQYMTTAFDTESSYTLPDGQAISVGSLKFRCPEAYFQPSLINMGTTGLHRKCHESILQCDPSIRSDMYSSIVLSGGSTLFPGFGDRMENELKKLAPSSTSIKVISPPYRKDSVWIGGSILASLSTFQKMFISKKEYEESGSSIVLRKCF